MAIIKSPIKPGTSLVPGDSVRSSNELFELIYRDDGDLVLHERLPRPPWKREVWNARTSPSDRATFEEDGRLVVHGGSGPVWSSEKSCPDGKVAELRVRDDGYVVACPRGSRDDRDVYWSSTPLAPAVHKGSLRTGQFLSPDEVLVSDNDVFELRYQAVDGNLALYAWSASGERFLWMPPWERPIGPAGCAGLDENGRLVVRAKEKDGLKEVWCSGVSAGKSARLRLRNDGNLVVCDDQGTIYWDTGTRFDFERYALLIGVESYSGVEGGKKNLFAGRNDVLAMWQVCRRLGYEPRNIRVCTSPQLTEKQIIDAEVDMALSQEENRRKSRKQVKQDVLAVLRGVDWEVTLCEATYKQINRSLSWLSERLGQPFGDQKGYLVPGILYYSGHGAQIEGDLALCPADVKQTGGGLANVLSFATLQAILDKKDDDAKDDRSPTRYLTVVLDCCFAGASSGKPSWLATSLTPPDSRSAGAPFISPAFGQRIFCASRSDEHAYQALLGGRWHGAFTWAFTQAMEQWTVATSRLHSYVNVSHAELLFRSRMLLEALSFPQHPMLLDSIVNTPVFWCGLETVEPGQMFRDGVHLSRLRSALAMASPSAEPDEKRVGIQMDPGTGGRRWYTIEADDGRTRTLIANVLVVGGNPVTIGRATYDADTESWFNVASLPSDTVALFVSWSDQTPGDLDGSTRCFTMTRTPQWSREAHPWTPGFFVDKTGTAPAIGIDWNLRHDADGKWVGALTWYSSDDNNQLFSGRDGSGIRIPSNPVTDYKEVYGVTLEPA